MTTDLLLLKHKTVLFAEDDTIIRNQITEVLEMLFDRVLSAADGKKAYELYEDESPDVVISDIKMPHMDGLSLIEKIRRNDYETPLLLLTGFSEKEMLVAAANQSVDGYIIKPVELNTLIDTLLRAMKRTQKNEGLFALKKNLFFNTATQEVFHNGTSVSLGLKELELLKLLIENRSRTITKEELSQALWPFESISESSIKNLILRLRKKLGDDLVVSVRGVGYRLDTRDEA